MSPTTFCQDVGFSQHLIVTLLKCDGTKLDIDVLLKMHLIIM